MSRRYRMRKIITLDEKIRILDRLNAGEKQTNVGKSLGLSEATVRTIRKNEQKIRESVAAGHSRSSNRVARTRDIELVQMENVLISWIGDCQNRSISIDGKMIRVKAIQIYNEQKEYDDSSPVTFSASKGWFENFKKRYQLKNISESNNELIIKDVEDNNEKLIPKITLTSLRKGIEIARQLEEHFVKNDPSELRSRIFKRELNYALAPYYSLLSKIEANEGDVTNDKVTAEQDPLLIYPKMDLTCSSDEE